MKFGVERAMPGPLGRRQRFVDGRDGALWIAGPRLCLGQPDFQQPVENQNVLVAQKVVAAPNLLEPAWPAAFGPHQALEKNSPRSP